MSGKHSAGKGSRYRKLDRQKWDEGWERIYGPKPDPKEQTPEVEREKDATNRPEAT